MEWANCYMYTRHSSSNMPTLSFSRYSTVYGMFMFKFCKIGEVRPVGKAFDPDYMLQTDRPQWVKQLLIVLVEVKKWPGFLSSSEINEVASYFGPIGNFKDIESDGYLVEVLIQLSDSNCSTFKIGNKEMI